MRKFFAVLILLILFLPGCSAPKSADLPEILLTIDGEAALTREDLLFARAYEGVSPKDRKDNEALFLRLAAKAVCMEISETWGDGQSYEEIAAEYEIWLTSLESTAQQAQYDALREELAQLSDDAFHRAFTDYLYRSACTEDLLDSIAAIYGGTTDAQTIREGILANLWELSDPMEICPYYPGIDFTKFDFEDLL